MLEERFVIKIIQLIVMLAILGSIVAGAAVIFAGFASILSASWEIAKHGDIDTAILRSFSVEVIEAADAFLLGVAMFMIAIGLYQLFIKQDMDVPLWLKTSTFTDLKENLLAVAIVLFGISFLGHVVEWEGDKNIIYLGVAIGAVLLPLVFMYRSLFQVGLSEEDEIAAETEARNLAAKREQETGETKAELPESARD